MFIKKRVYKRMKMCYNNIMNMCEIQQKRQLSLNTMQYGENICHLQI